ncbi:MAG: hypothetical protein K9J27_05995 [Bacteroidales bacterium]|nr:hypothetical protein [Bacteroidales bacterium]
MIKEIILGIMALVGLGMALSKRDIVFTITTFGLAAGAYIFILGIQTINISFFVAFSLLTFLLAIGQKGIPAPNRLALALISLFVILAEVAFYQEWNSAHLFRYMMVIPLAVYFMAVMGTIRVERGLACATIIAADALAILIEGVV